jgi:hypothetical protein
MPTEETLDNGTRPEDRNNHMTMCAHSAAVFHQGLLELPLNH